jgi:hypothetical protein
LLDYVDFHLGYMPMNLEKMSLSVVHGAPGSRIGFPRSQQELIRLWSADLGEKVAVAGWVSRALLQNGWPPALFKQLVEPLKYAIQSCSPKLHYPLVVK